MDQETLDGGGNAHPSGRDRIRLRFWGTRGSVPSPGAATAAYGANTACLEVLVGGRRYVMDAGTGARELGLEIMSTERAPRATVFLTHFHWDHIQGLPFFRPLFHPEAELRIVGPRQGETDIRDLLELQMGSPYFPIPLSRKKAQTTFEHLNEGSWSDGAVHVAAMRVCHGSFTVGYRLEAPGFSLCYVPDNELGGHDHGLDPSWRDRFAEFISGSDILIHDAMYTAEEFVDRQGWGHSSFDQCLGLALEAGVKRLVFFHHDPERTDDDLDRQVDRARNRVGRNGSLEVDAAREGGVLAF